MGGRMRQKRCWMYMCMFVDVSATYIFFTLSSPFVTLVVIWRFAKNPFSCFFGVVLIVNGHLRRRDRFGMVFVVVALLAFLSTIVLMLARHFALQLPTTFSWINKRRRNGGRNAVTNDILLCFCCKLRRNKDNRET